MTTATDRFYDRIRHGDANSAEADAGAGLEVLRGHKYALLTTFRRSGAAVPTPIWFGSAGERAYVRTEADSGKVKRIRANGRALIGPCSARGKPLGPMAEATARIVAADSEAPAEAALRSSYGLGRRIYQVFSRRMGVNASYIEIVPTKEPT